MDVRCAYISTRTGYICGKVVDPTVPVPLVDDYKRVCQQHYDQLLYDNKHISIEVKTTADEYVDPEEIWANGDCVIL